MKAKANVLMLVAFVLSAGFLFAREMSGPPVKSTVRGAIVRIDANRPNLSEAQVIRSAQLRQMIKNQEELTLLASDRDGATIDLVPGGGDIFDNWHVTFNTVADFDIFTLTDPLGLGNDWAWNAADSSAFAPEPAVGTGRDEGIQVKIGVAKESDTAVPYQVANLILEVTVDEGDADDYLEVGLLEGPKWHRDDFGSHTADDSVWWVGDKKWDTWGYGNRWLEYLDTNPIDLTSASAPICSIYTTWILENPSTGYGWDAATVFALSSADADYDTWTEIVPASGYTRDNMFAWNIQWAIREGVAESTTPGVPTAGNHGGWGGDEDLHPGEAWHIETFDLSAFIGQTIIIRFALAGDECYSPAAKGCETYPDGDGDDFDGGWWLDDIKVTAAAGGSNLVTDLTPSADGAGFEPEPWQSVATFDATDPGTGAWKASFGVTRSIIGSWEDSLTVGFMAVYDDDNTAAPDVGFKVNDALLQIYTRLEVDAGVTFVDLVSAGDSTLQNNGYALVGGTYTPVTTIQNHGLSDIPNWFSNLEIKNSFGDLVYEESIYYYNDPLLMYPGFRDTSFAAWTIADEGDYTLRVYFEHPEALGPDDEPLNDAIEIGFHAFSTQPAAFFPLDEADSDALFAGGWTFDAGRGDTSFAMYSYTGVDPQVLWHTQLAAADSMDERLISPVVDLSGGTNHALKFEQYLYAASGTSSWRLDIEGTVDGGTNWSTILSTTGAKTIPNLNNFTLDISAFDGEATFQLGVHLTFADTLGAQGSFAAASVDGIAIYTDPDLTAPAAPTGVAAVGRDMGADLSWAAVAGAGVMYYSVYDQVITPGCDLTEVVVDIVPDSYPGETSWDIAEAATGDVVAGGDADGGTACLAAGDYVFTIYDSWGDGMDGSYSVTTYSVDTTVVIDVSSDTTGSWASYALPPFTVTGITPTDPDTSAVTLVTDVSETSVTIGSLANGSAYSYWVSATDHNGNEGDTSSAVHIVPADVTAPTAIEDLVAKADADTVYLDWTTPDESGFTWSSSYDIRYSSAPITDATFAAATAVHDSVMVPVGAEGSAAATEVYLTAAAAGSEYFFAIKTTDEADNVSTLSNVASTDYTAPDSVGDLALTGPTTPTTATDVLTLSWTAPGDDGDVGTATSYEVRIAYSVKELDWASATGLDVAVTPAAAGTAESVTFDPATRTDIYPMYDMAIALIAIDDNGNESAVSNVAVWSPVSSIADGRGIPTAYGITQNYPNPFNPSTRIEFALPEQANVVLKVYNLLGQEVKELVMGEYTAGYHTVTWNATDNASNKVPSGVYFYRITAGSFSKTTKMVLLK